MVDRITTRMGSVVRPGVFVSQRGGLGGPQPLSNHAVGYLYATIDEEYDSLKYSSLLPYTPTQILSLSDYANLCGGVPISSGSRISYDSVNAFFQNAGPNGVLYVTRVVPTPETVLTTRLAGFGYKHFAIKVNGRYLGNIPTGEYDEDLDEISVISTTGIDSTDNALDIFRFLDSSKEFNYTYKAEQDAQDIELDEFRIFSKDPTRLVEVEQFKAYKFIEDIKTATNEVDLNPYTKSYTPSKDLVVKLRSREMVSGKEILFIDGNTFDGYLTANTITLADDAAFVTQLQTYVETYLGYTNLVVGQLVAVSKSLNGNLDDYAGYRSVTAVGPLTLSGTAPSNIPVSDLTTRTGYLPDSVQVLYIEIAGENRVVVINGNGVKELGDDLVTVLKGVFEEKGILPYFDIENVSAYSPNTFSYLPNNGYSLTSATLADHGFPVLKPSLDDSLLVGSVDSIDLGTKTITFATDLALDVRAGAVIFVGPNKFTVASSTTTTLTLVESLIEVDVNDKVYLDRSEANGFYNFDYILKVRITSKNGSKPPVYPGLDRNGTLEDSIAYLPSPIERPNYSVYKYSDRAKAQDFVYAITNSLEKKLDAQPGLIFAPEAYATIIEGVDDNTRAEARSLRLRISAAIATVAEGRLNSAENSASSQHIGLIDCGGDISTIEQAREELFDLRTKIGSAFGHLSYYAPHVINGVGNIVPLSAYVAGVACSRYLNEGFQQAPAGSRYPLRDASGLSFAINSQQQEVTYGLGLNPARELPNRGIVIWGARTISSNPLFKYVSTRAILNVLLDVLNRSFDDILFEQINSSDALFTRVRTTAVTILQQFYNRGALFGNDPSEAYRVICDYSNNTNESLENGSLACDIYVATSPTLERLFISVVRTAAGQISLITDNRTSEQIRYNQSLVNF